MRRQEFLACTGLSADQYAYMVRHDHLPYADSLPREGWADYSAHQVLLTCVTVALAPLVGGQAEAARRTVEVPHSELRRMWGGLFRPHLGDVFAVTFVTREPTSNPHFDLERVGWVFSLLDTDGGAVNLPAELIGASTHSVPTVNLSAIMRGIVERAAAAGIPFAEDVNA